MQVITDLVAELEDIILKQDTYKDAVHEAQVFLDKHSTLDNEGYLEYKARCILSRFKDINSEV